MANQATRSFDLAGYVPGSPLVVTIETVIDQGITIVYGILETYPAGWTVSDITGPGDDTGTMVNWTFLDNQNETVMYTLTPPPGTSGQAVWSGELGAMGQQGSSVVPIDCPCTLDELVLVPHPADNGFGDGIFEAPCLPGDFVLCFEEVMDYALHFRIGDDEYFPPWLVGMPRLMYVLVAAMIWRVTDLKRYEDAGDPGLPQDDLDYAFQRWQSVPDIP